MSRNVKCQTCKLSTEPKEQMIKDKKGYFHPGECYSKYLNDVAFNEKENNEKASLYDTICLIHNISIIDKRFYPFIEDLRNGSIRFQGKPIEKKKQGVEYSIIKEAYLASANDIKYWKANKQFDSCFGELKYCLTIVTGKINEIVKQKQQKERAEQEIKHKTTRIVHIDDIGTNRKKEDALDISDFL